MKNAFKHIGLTAVLLSFSAATYAANDTDPCVGVRQLISDNANKSSTQDVSYLLSVPSPQVQSCAIRAAGETKNASMADALYENVRGYILSSQNKGHYEDNMNARLKALDSIWALGEIGEPKVMAKLLKMFDMSDDIVKINMAIGAGKAKKGDPSPFLYKLAANTEESNEVRAAAYEMLGERRAKSPAPVLSKVNGMEKGDLIYTGGIFGIPQGWIKDTPVGHAGLYAGTEVKDGKIVVAIYDCVPDSFKPVGGVRKIFSFYNFTHHTMYAFYGNRVSSPAPTPAQRDMIIKAAEAKVGHHYSDSHFSQKGPEDFDCVGYTEYAYEAAGLNPTPNDQETSWGWPLTPAEQFAATFSNSYQRPPLLQAADNSFKAMPAAGILDGEIGSLTKSFGMGVMKGPEVSTNIAPASAE
ncbi:MAG: hypothetical protein HY952_05755 [Elusimicrobia bacterium]|nr:hypothetical protein [Elusimicrobiota bacterium]